MGPSATTKLAQSAASRRKTRARPGAAIARARSWVADSKPATRCKSLSRALLGMGYQTVTKLISRANSIVWANDHLFCDGGWVAPRLLLIRWRVRRPASDP